MPVVGRRGRRAEDHPGSAGRLEGLTSGDLEGGSASRMAGWGGWRAVHRPGEYRGVGARFDIMPNIGHRGRGRGYHPSLRRRAPVLKCNQPFVFFHFCKVIGLQLCLRPGHEASVGVEALRTGIRAPSWKKGTPERLVEEKLDEGEGATSGCSRARSRLSGVPGRGLFALCRGEIPQIPRQFFQVKRFRLVQAVQFRIPSPLQAFLASGARITPVMEVTIPLGTPRWGLESLNFWALYCNSARFPGSAAAVLDSSLVYA